MLNFILCVTYLTLNTVTDSITSDTRLVTLNRINKVTLGLMLVVFFVVVFLLCVCVLKENLKLFSKKNPFIIHFPFTKKKGESIKKKPLMNQLVLNSLYLRWSSIPFIIISRLLCFTVIYIRIPIQFILSNFYIFVLYKTLELIPSTTKYYESLQHCIIGIIWACFFILDMIRSVIEIELYIILPIDFLYMSILVYTIYCKEDNIKKYYSFIAIFVFCFLFQLDHKQTLILTIMRDIFFYTSYYICLYVFNVQNAISNEKQEEIIIVLIKAIICSSWFLLYFFSQYYYPIYIIVLLARMAYFNEDPQSLQQKKESILPVVSDSFIPSSFHPVNIHNSPEVKVVPPIKTTVQEKPTTQENNNPQIPKITNLRMMNKKTKKR